MEAYDFAPLIEAATYLLGAGTVYLAAAAYAKIMKLFAK